MKTKEELNALKKEVEALNKKLADLTEDELKQVVGGSWGPDWGEAIRECSVCGYSCKSNPGDIALDCPKCYSKGTFRQI